MLPLAVDLAILLLLLAVLGLGLRLRRGISAMRADHAGLEQLIGGLTTASQRAESALGELRRSAGEAGERIGQDLARAQRLSDELRLLNDRADRLADGLVEGIRAARQAHGRAPADRPASSEVAATAPRPVEAASAPDLERALRTLR